MSTADADLVDARSPQGRGLLAATVLGSGMALLDGTVVNVALRRIGAELGASVSQLQWVVNAYMLALAGLILVGGALGDLLGRRRIYLVGVVWFAVASAACAVAQTPNQLIVARLVQGVGAALLTPGSLAIIQASVRRRDRAPMIGRWAGLGGIAAALGPLLGGWLVDVASWRWVFGINVPIAVVVVVLCLRSVPESRDEEAARPFDVTGALAAALGLAGVTYALIHAGEAAGEATALTGGLGATLLVLFVLRERRAPNPLIPPRLFASRVFTVANGMTLVVYGALGSVLFFLVLQLQAALGFSPFEAGLATAPLSVVLLLLSGRSGALAERIGPRLQLTVGPVLCAVGVVMLRWVGAGDDYLVDVLPGLLVFSFGLVTLVAPVTATVLAAAPDRLAGTASGVNNAVARTGSLLAVAALPTLVGLSGNDYLDAAAFTPGYVRAQDISALLLAAGGALCFVGLRGVGGEGAGVARPEGP